jgi:hypothetical protein
MNKVLLVLALAVAVAVPVASGASNAPAVTFVTPKANAATGSTVTFDVKLKNFSLDPADVGKRNKAHRGHLHFQMDGGKFDYPKYSGANGTLAKALGIAGMYSPSIAPQIVYRHLPAGTHTLRVFLANNDHSPVGAKATVRFTVR